MSRLSKRERVMLYVLLLLALAVAGYYLVYLPLDGTHTSQQALLETLRTQEMNAKIVLLSADSAQEDLAMFEAASEVLRVGYQPTRTNAEIDELLTALVLRHGLTPEHLDITQNETVGVVALGVDEKTLSVEQRETLPTACVALVDIGCVGTLPAALALCDEAAATNGLMLTAFVHTPGGTDEDGRALPDGFALQLAVYMEGETINP